MIQIAQLTTPNAVESGGPFYFPASGGLRWVDMSAGDIVHLDAAYGTVDRRPVAPA